MERFSEFFSTPLIEFSGGTITPGSIVAAVVVVGASQLLTRMATMATGRILTRRNAEPGATFAAIKVMRYVLLTLGFILSIGAMGLELNALLTASAALLVGVGLGLQNLFQNVAAGFVLLFEQPIRRGDFIQLGDMVGEVTDIGLRATHVLTRARVMMIVPNSELVSTKVVNLSQPTPPVRVKIKVGVAHGSDLPLVEKVLFSVARENPDVLTEPVPEVWFEAFGEWRLEFALLVWVKNPGEEPRVASSVRFAIDREFRAHGIVIPVPQQDLHIKSAQGLDRRGAA